MVLSSSVFSHPRGVTLKKKALQTSVTVSWSTWHDIPPEFNLQVHCCMDLISHEDVSFFFFFTIADSNPESDRQQVWEWPAAADRLM